LLFLLEQCTEQHVAGEFCDYVNILINHDDYTWKFIKNIQ